MIFSLFLTDLFGQGVTILRSQYKNKIHFPQEKASKRITFLQYLFIYIIKVHIIV